MKNWKHGLVKIFLENNSGFNVNFDVLQTYIQDLYLSSQHDSTVLHNYRTLLHLHPNLRWRFLVFHLRSHPDEEGTRILCKEQGKLQLCPISHLDLTQPSNSIEILGETFSFKLQPTSKAI